MCKESEKQSVYFNKFQFTTNPDTGEARFVLSDEKPILPATNEGIQQAILSNEVVNQFEFVIPLNLFIRLSKVMTDAIESLEKKSTEQE